LIRDVYYRVPTIIRAHGEKGAPSLSLCISYRWCYQSCVHTWYGLLVHAFPVMILLMRVEKGYFLKLKG